MSIFGKFTAAVLETVLLPIEVVKDVATMGGVTNDHGSTYTGDRLKSIGQSVEEALEEMKD